MRSAIIAPTAFLERYSASSDYHLCLAHLVNSDPKYAAFYRDAAARGDFVILDNSTIELGRPVEFGELQRAVDLIQPSELVLADFHQDPQETYTWAVNYGEKFKGLYSDLKLMVVPQWYGSHRLESWLDNYADLARLEFVDTIGIPKFLTTKRYDACTALTEGVLEYHLLGTWGNPAEIRTLVEDFPWIRGVDSKAPVRAGLAGVALHPTDGLLIDREGLPPMEFGDTNDPFPSITNHNVKLFHQWAASEKNRTAEVLEFRR